MCSSDLITALIDTGASVNVIDETQFEKLSPRPKITPTAARIYTYGGHTPIPLRGVIQVQVRNGEWSTYARFHVTEGRTGTLLSCHTAEDLGLVFFAKQVHEAHAENILEDFPQLFKGLGCLKGHRVKLHIDESVQPVALRHRRVPFHLRPAVECELEQLEKLGVIEKVVGPTPWVSPLVIAPKPKQPGAIRLCVDMRLPNKAITRERHITPTIDEIVADLNGACWFSKIDLNAGYHQLELEETSRYITTFSTHVGLRRYKRLSFGISSAAEVFQEAIRQALSGLVGVLNVSDDILIYSNTLEEHHQRLRATLQRLADCELTLHQKKCVFYTDSIEFFGYRFSRAGLQVDPKKVVAIRTASVPQNPTEVRSFLGMATYCGRFIPNLATLSEPLRVLTKKDQKWNWDQSAQQAFQKVKGALLAEETMAYFNPRRRTELIVDASPVGLGAVLMQEQGKEEWGPVAYASRALSDTETRYAQIEREALAVRWACRHFHLYLCGKTFRVITDHKPLVPLFMGTARNGPPRIERWAVQLQPYSFEITYRPGVNNPADYLSRHPPPTLNQESQGDVDEGTEDFIKMVSDIACPKTLSIGEIAEATRNDPHLTKVREALPGKQWKYFLAGHQALNDRDKRVRDQLWRIRDELSITQEGAVLRGHRIVIPSCLWDRVIDLAHQGHQGIAKTKARLRTKVWFAGMDDLVEERVRSCHPCAITGEEARPAPVITEPGCGTPWTHVSMDFGSFPDGRFTLVLIDSHTRFPIVELVSSTAFHKVKKVLDQVFALLGVPAELKTDNGPPFQGHEFETYLRSMNVKHRRITPLWPQANGEVERFMRTLNKAMRIAVEGGQELECALQQFLRAYRVTPHSTTGCAPGDLLMNRDLRDVIPAGPHWKPALLNFPQAECKRARTNEQASRSRRAVRSNLVVGDRVLVKDRHPGWKFRTRFEPEIWKVVGIKGTMVTAQCNRQEITRNVSWFKRTGGEAPRGDGEVPEEEEAPAVVSNETCLPIPERTEEGGSREVPAKDGAPAHVSAEGPPEVGARGPNHRYGLRPHPRPSQRLKDFVQDF